MTIHPATIGIDVSKHHLDVFDPREGAVRRVANNPAQTAQLAREWARHDALVVFEATGCYDAHLRSALARAGVAQARINPEQARAFASAIGRRAKTDAVDARMLAEFGQKLAPRRQGRADPERERLAALNKRRDQLVAMRQQERTRRTEWQGEDGDEIGADLDHHLAWLDAAIAQMDEAIRALLRASPALHEAELRLRSVPGVGPVTATVLLAAMPELGACSPKAAAALAGLAPYNNDSGRFRGKRSVRGGRKRVRDALYMAAVSAARTHTRLGAFYRRLRDAGKPPKLALIALARKMLTILNAVARDQIPFQPA